MVTKKVLLVFWFGAMLESQDETWVQLPLANKFNNGALSVVQMKSLEAKMWLIFFQLNGQDLLVTEMVRFEVSD